MEWHWAVIALQQGSYLIVTGARGCGFFAHRTLLAYSAALTHGDYNPSRAGSTRGNNTEPFDSKDEISDEARLAERENCGKMLPCFQPTASARVALIGSFNALHSADKFVSRG
jgi:hypothetical protein